MAVQLQVALSSKIRGAASLAGGIYGCAEGKPSQAQKICMKNPGAIVAANFVKKAIDRAEAKTIDPIANLAQAKIYLFQSQADKTVHPSSVNKLRDFFAAFTTNIRVELHETAAHGFPTLESGNSCEKEGIPWLQRCGRDVAGEILEYFYSLSPPSSSSMGELIPFDQSLYASKNTSLLPEGYVYVPTTCLEASCRLHIAFHGCKMSTAFAQKRFMLEAGYNRWADTNRIVIIYPQAKQNPLNPNGCWDWYGYTGSDYSEKNGQQIQFITNILKHYEL